jgi:4-hydroxy-2-oxoglutarate aldolase
VQRTLLGIFGPVTTTFDALGELDLDGFAKNLSAHIAAGLHGILIAGSTGEAALLDETERHQLLETARRVIPTDRWMLAGTGAESTRACVRRCKDAAERGADAVLVVAPHYYSNAMTLASLQAHYERVADESPVPVMLYNIPKYMHFRLDGELVSRLAEHDNVIGMKDSSGDIAYLEHYIAARSDSFAVLTGHAGTVLRALQMGATGGILAASLFVPELCLDLYRAHVEGRTADADDAQRRLTPSALEIVGRMGIPAVKYAMERAGYVGGAVRLPLLDASDEDRAAVDAILREVGATVAR